MSQQATLKIALLGNPNTGKTTLFNSLAGLNHKTGNYPGVTVEVKKGKSVHQGIAIEWVDLPGTYSLAARSPDEMLAVDLVLGRIPNESRPDVLLCLADATNMERNLYLVSQAKEMGIPIVVAVTMMDLAKHQGITIDYNKLQKAFNIPFFGINTLKGIGLSELKSALIDSSRNPKASFESPLPEPIVSSAIELAKTLQHDLPPILGLRALLDEGGSAEIELHTQFGSMASNEIANQRNRLKQAGFALSVVEPRYRYKDIRHRLEGVISRPPGRISHSSDQVDKWLVHPVWGLFFFFLVMFLLFQSIFVIARPLMDLISSLVENLKSLIEASMPPGPFTSLLLDGVISGVGGVVVFLPQIMILFGFLSFLEDCGYMARAAFLMDRVMCRCGLSGKSFIPMLSSLACAVPGILSTRVIENRRDRIVTILVAPLMSCSARLPVYYLLTEAFFPDPWWLAGFVIFLMYLIGFVAAPMVALVLKGWAFKGDQSVFVLEMPVYRMPSLFIILRRMWDSGISFLYRAGTLILASMIIVWALLYFPNNSPEGESYPEIIQNASEEERQSLHSVWRQQSFLGRIGQFMEPAFSPLGWDWRIGMSVLASFPAREVVVAALNVSFGEEDSDQDEVEGRKRLIDTMVAAKKPDGSQLFTQATALSLLVFFALCCQCASTLVVIWKETQSWFWALMTFVYMTGLAYCMAFFVYQISRSVGM